ncbi:MAG: fibronectin type III domain-containing protein, partial [Elusimicrobia bacterium]|nr:fibronectin type III domain-containing protein [Elusimicrobiota bacterium]
FPTGAVVTISYTYNLYLSSSGLNANTTYYFQVAAINNNDVPTSYTTSKGTSTFVEFAPVFNNFTGMAANAIQFNWTDTSNPAGTLYRVLTSTVDNPATFPQGAVVTSSDTYNLYLSSSGLKANTTYYFQMAAINNNDVPTSYTSSKGTSTLVEFAPVFNNFTGMAANAIQFNWTDTNNPSGTLYRVLTSTVDNPSTFPSGAVVTSSYTYNLYLNSTGLNANTTYYFQVAAINNNDVPTNYTGSQSTSTFAVMPADVNFTGITDNTIQFNWSANGNSEGTLYRVLASTVANPSTFPAGAVVTTSDTYNTFLSSAGLNPDTNYYFQVAAINNNGLITSYTTDATALTLPPGGLGAPIIGSITNVYITSITANWSMVSGATGYTLAASVNPDNPPSPIYASSTTLGDLNAAVFNPALVPNTTYYLFVQANGPNKISSWSAYPGTSTLVEFAPIFNNFTGMAANAIQFNWTDTNNPSGTLYRVLTSTVDNPSTFPTGAVVTSSYTYNLYLSSTNLKANTTYYFQVAAINNNDVPTNYTGSQSTSTVAIMPTDVQFTGMAANAVQFNWTDTNNPSGTRYRVLTSTVDNPSTFPTGAVVTSSYTYNLYLSSTNLKANTTYYFQVAAINNNDVPTSYTSSKGTSTFVEFAPVFNNFTGMAANAVQFNWTDTNNPSGTRYRVLTSTVGVHTLTIYT